MEDIAKRCVTCDVEGPLDAFYRNPATADGYDSSCKSCRNIRNVAWKKTNRGRVNEGKRNRTQVLRREAIAAYGGICVCCGESEPDFLALDHINGGGRQHRRKAGNGGQGFLLWLKRNDYPDELRVLCHNCNMACGMRGVCPHQRVGTR